jgi:hypothetical protein
LLEYTSFGCYGNILRVRITSEHKNDETSLSTFNFINILVMEAKKNYKIKIEFNINIFISKNISFLNVLNI